MKNKTRNTSVCSLPSFPKKISSLEYKNSVPPICQLTFDADWKVTQEKVISDSFIATFEVYCSCAVANGDTHTCGERKSSATLLLLLSEKHTHWKRMRLSDGNRVAIWSARHKPLRRITVVDFTFL